MSNNDTFPAIVFCFVILITFNEFLNPILQDFLAVDWKRIGIIFGAVVGILILAFFTIRNIILKKKVKEGYIPYSNPEPEENEERLIEEVEEPEERVIEQPVHRVVNIRVDETKGFFKKSEITDDEVTYLKNKGYIESTHMSIVTKSMERYLLKPASNESPSHFFLIQDICNYIKKFTDKVWTYNTVKPDIVFIDKRGRKVAIEVETGKVLKYKPERLPQKVKHMTENYDDWFFVVTDGNLVREYKNYGKTYEKRSITKILSNLVSGTN
ncbi:MAG: hypothetical protein Q8R00_03155 [Candidatus Nanoarchaeia archaeon]|nr:hypothetical protein [Candidatus Nanoarchaeia archaeon]